MELEELAGQIAAQHTETKGALIKLGDKVECVKLEQAKLRTEIDLGVIKVGTCEAHRNIIHAEIRKVGRINKIVGVIATMLGAIGAGIMWIVARLWRGGVQ